MAHTKSGGTSKNLRESASKRLGVKKNHGEPISVGQIIIRQRGTKYLLGLNVKEGRDNTIYAVKNGKVSMRPVKKTRFDGSRRYATLVEVVS